MCDELVPDVPLASGWPKSVRSIRKAQGCLAKPGRTKVSLLSLVTFGEAIAYVKAIGEHCRAKGISVDKNGNGPVIIIADEIPSFSSNELVMKRTVDLARLIKKADPRTVVVINSEIPDDPEILGLLDMFTARGSPEKLVKLRRMGKRYGDYYMGENFNVTQSALQPRVQFWSYWNAGYSFIGSWVMSMDPITSNPRCFGGYCAGNWWFPGMKGEFAEPMSTIRFEQMREGLEDFEYLWQLSDRVEKRRAAGGAGVSRELLARAEAALKGARADAGKYTQNGSFIARMKDPTRLLSLRHEIGETLEAFAESAPAAKTGGAAK